MPDLDELRFITYLAPAIPRQLFQAVVDHVGARVGVRVSLRCATRVSGPEADGDDPFSRNRADLGWVCAPSYVWMRERSPAPVELLPAAPVFRDARNRGRPSFFSEVVVRRGDPFTTFVALEGRRWAYNDACSLSGYYSVLRKLAALRANGSFFNAMLPSGGHLRSIELVVEGKADGAAIDSNVLALLLDERPELREAIRVVEAWGPFPIQPLIARAGLPRPLVEKVAAVLLGMHADARMRPILARHRIARFARISEEEYESERRALRACPRPPADGGMHRGEFA